MANNSILSFDYREQQRRNEIWLENREHRGNIYNSFSKYINFLEKLLNEEKDEDEKFLIERRIKKLKKEQEKYYDACILAMPIEKNKFDEEEQEVEESKSLIKRIFKKKI